MSAVRRQAVQHKEKECGIEDGCRGSNTVYQDSAPVFLSERCCPCDDVEKTCDEIECQDPEMKIFPWD